MNVLKGVNSALGFSAKDLPESAYETFDKMKVPSKSQQQQTNIANAYIVYNTNQVKMKYLIRLKAYNNYDNYWLTYIYCISK